jgi:hypothetical protein
VIKPDDRIIVPRIVLMQDDARVTSLKQNEKHLVRNANGLSGHSRVQKNQEYEVRLEKYVI